MTKRLVRYGIVGLVIAIALIASLQVRPPTLLPSMGELQISVTSDPLTSNPLAVICHGNSNGNGNGNRGGQKDQVENLTSLVVNIASIQVHRTGALNLTRDWISIPNAPKTLDLLNLKTFSQFLGSASMPDGVINLVRLTVGSTASASNGTSSKAVIVSSGHLDAQTNAQVTSGKVTSIILEFVRPHVICEGNGDLRLTPELAETLENTD